MAAEGRQVNVVVLFLLLCAFVVGLLITVGPFTDYVRWSTVVAVPDKTPQLTTDELRYVMYGDGDAHLLRTDPRYFDHVRTLIARPSALPRNITHRLHMDHASIVDRLLGGRRNGFFVECGASDGDFWSNTLFLEVERNWTGLLVDANKRFFRQLLGKHRQAFAFGGCLSPINRPVNLKFKAAGYQGGMAKYLGQFFNAHITSLKSLESVDSVYCVPLDDLLAALGVNHVDFLSLDVQGAELPILKTIDFRSLTVDLIITEAATDKLKSALRQFFNETGLYRIVDDSAIGNNDMIAQRIIPK